jgi:hypothetical protein
MNIEARGGGSNWCQVQMTYFNQSTQDLAWPDYQPVFSVAAPDGSILRRWKANYYSTDQGWPNGIAGVPPTIPAGKSSFLWTWYTATGGGGEYCRYVAVQWQGVTHVAEFNPQGKLVNAASTAR